MDQKEELQKLQKEIKENFEKISQSANNLSEILSLELDKRVLTSNEVFLKEVNNLSLISVTAAPFSLLLSQTGFVINEFFLGTAFVILMLNVALLNIGVWHLNSRYQKNSALHLMNTATITLNALSIKDEKLETQKRLESLTSLMKNQGELEKKKKLEPWEQANLLKTLRSYGLILLILGAWFLIFSVLYPYLECGLSFLLGIVIS